MKTKLIILDGAKGAGKSTVSELLRKKTEHVAFVGLDQIRSLVAHARAGDDINNIIFDVIFSVTRQFLQNGISVVIDSGVNEERALIFKQIAHEQDATLLMYYLSAPKDILKKRVQERDLSRGKTFNEERFDYVYEIQQSKDFSDFTEISSHDNSPDEIAEIIFSKII